MTHAVDYEDQERVTLSHEEVEAVVAAVEMAIAYFEKHLPQEWAFLLSLKQALGKLSSQDELTRLH